MNTTVHLTATSPARNPRFFMTGGTGLIGRSIQRELVNQELGGSILTRSVTKAKNRIYPGFKGVAGDITTTAWLHHLAHHDVIIHLAGYPLFQQRWSQQTKQMIHQSRILGTQNLVQGIKSLPKEQRPKRIISASAIGYYGISSGDTWLDESTGAGDDFLAATAQKWEESAADLQEMVDEFTIFRIGVVLSLEGGMLERVVPIFRSGFGGRLSTGYQWISWIHLHDATQIILKACLSPHWQPGVYNLCAPHPVTNRQFTKALGKRLRRPSFIPVPEAVLRKILGEGSRYVTTGQRVSSNKLTQAGESFQFSNIESALADLIPSR